MVDVEPQHLDVLDALYRRHRQALEPLPQALRHLSTLAESYARQTGQAVAPWNLWAAILRRQSELGPLRRRGA